jgi:hypothetical protein
MALGPEPPVPQGLAKGIFDTHQMNILSEAPELGQLLALARQLQAFHIRFEQMSRPHQQCPQGHAHLALGKGEHLAHLRIQTEQYDQRLLHQAFPYQIW